MYIHVMYHTDLIWRFTLQESYWILTLYVILHSIDFINSQTIYTLRNLCSESESKLLSHLEHFFLNSDLRTLLLLSYSRSLIRLHLSLSSRLKRVCGGNSSHHCVIYS